jgi:hypothetical protein
MKKVCKNCKLEKDYQDFYQDKRTSTGRYSICRKCHEVVYMKGWRDKNKDYYRNYIRNYVVQRRKVDIKFRLDCRMGSALCDALGREKKWRKWTALVGYSAEDLVKHLESKFENWMTLENYGKWEIDHIIPKSSFKYKTPEDPEFKKCWGLENLQPLEKSKNRLKANKIQ